MQRKLAMAILRNKPNRPTNGWDVLMYMLTTSLRLVLLATWVAGFVIAEGVVSTVFAIIPLWSWYLVIEKLLIINGII